MDRVVETPLPGQPRRERIEAGIAWLTEWPGERFSWASIFDHVLPERLRTPLFGHATRYSCANLIACYLEIGGGVDGWIGMRPPMVITPNDLARIVGPL